jgi:polysaccharide export outer membrane protein
MRRSISFGLIGLLLASILAAQKQEAVPKDLMECVRQARKAGLTDSQIKLNAVRVGWPPEDLNAALEPPGGAPAAKPKTAETRKPVPKGNPSPSAVAIEPAEPRRIVNEPVGRGGAPIIDQAYVIGAEDILDISVWHEAELTRQVVVRPDGKITIPLAGELTAAGLTLPQLSSAITEGLKKYIITPEVNVAVQAVNSKKYWVQGEVLKPGPYPLVVPTTVMEGLSNAGGFKDFANLKKITILRGKERLLFNYKDFRGGKHLEQNILLQPGDQILVP